MTTNPRRLPLEGIKIAEVTVVWAGPHVTQVLGEWGADVIRVEPVNKIQPYSRGGERVTSSEVAINAAVQGQLTSAYADLDPGDDPWNRNSAFNAHARNKRSMACDITSPEGREAFLRLLKQVDVFIENNVPETIEKANLTWDVVREVNPRLIMVRMPAYGLNGPYKNYRGFGTHVEGMIGHHLLRSYPDESPEHTGDAFTADALAGVMGAFAIVSAIRSRARTGLGQQIEMPLAEAFLPVLGEYLLDYTMNGRTTPPQGNLHPSHAPHGVYPTDGHDQWIAIDVWEDDQWRALCTVLGADALAADERFATKASRHRHRDALDRALPEFTRGREKEALFHALQAAGVCAAPIHDELEALQSEQLNARGFFETVDMEGVGPRVYPGIMTKWANTPNHIRRPPARLGEHSHEIYVDMLGYSEEEYQAMVAKGLIGDTYPERLVPRTWKR